MRGLVIGLGSMGKRRIRLMKGFFEGVELCGVDSNEQRRTQANELFSLPCFSSIKEAVAEFKPETAFVCTSPLSHSAIIEELLSYSLNVFTEINLVTDGYEKNQSTAKEKGVVLFLSSTPLYRRETQFIEKTVKQTSGALCYRYHVGQYLPDWHPWENYKDFFVGDKRTNGCREIFAIQLPWLVSSFGKIVKAEAVPMKQTSLKIDYPDSFFVTLYHEGGTVGQFDVNVVSRKAVTDLEVIGENLYLKWNGTPKGLSVYDYDKKEDRAIDTYESVTKDSRYAENIIENAYVDELSAFFDALKGKAVRRHSFENDAEILKIIDGIEGIE